MQAALKKMILQSKFSFSTFIPGFDDLLFYGTLSFNAGSSILLLPFHLSQKGYPTFP